MAIGSGVPTKNQLAARLRRAAFSGDFKKVFSLLKQGADPNSPDKGTGLAPLHYAASAGHANVCQLLADAGAIVDAADANGDTPLICCVSSLGVDSGIIQPRTHPSAAKATCLVLLAAGADPSLANASRKTPLHAAAFSGYPSILDLLLTRGADPSARDADGDTALHLASYGLWDKQGNGCRALLAAGADPNARNLGGGTPLHCAAGSSFGEFSIVALLEAGADVGAKDNELRAPLHAAAEAANLEACRRLADAGADLFAKDRAGKTPKEAPLNSELGKEVEALLAAAMLRVEMGERVPKAKQAKSPRTTGRSRRGI